MGCKIGNLSFALVVVGIGLANPAGAGPTVPHKERVVGMAETDFDTLTQVFQGTGRATHMGRFEVMGSNQFTLDGQIVNGTFISTAADGSTISGIYEGTFALLDGGLVFYELTGTYLEGTGRLADVTGEALVTALLDLATGEFHYETLGTWTFP